MWELSSSLSTMQDPFEFYKQAHDEGIDPFSPHAAARRKTSSL